MSINFSERKPSKKKWLLENLSFVSNGANGNENVYNYYLMNGKEEGLWTNFFFEVMFWWEIEKMF